MRINPEALEDATTNTSPGPWTVDTFETDGDRGPYDAYCIRDGEQRIVLDTMNSDVQTIYERDHRWDEQGKLDLQLIAKLHSLLPAILDMTTWRDITTLPMNELALVGRYVDVETHRRPVWQKVAVTRIANDLLNGGDQTYAITEFSHWLPLDFDPPRA